MASDRSSIPITISPREPKFITMLVESIPIDVNFGPVSYGAMVDEVRFEVYKILAFVEFELDYISGLNLVKSSKEETPRIFSLKYLKLNQEGKMSN